MPQKERLQIHGRLEIQTNIIHFPYIFSILYLVSIRYKQYLFLYHFEISNKH